MDTQSCLFRQNIIKSPEWKALAGSQRGRVTEKSRVICFELAILWPYCAKEAKNVHLLWALMASQVIKKCYQIRHLMTKIRIEHQAMAIGIKWVLRTQLLNSYVFHLISTCRLTWNVIIHRAYFTILVIKYFRVYLLVLKTRSLQTPTAHENL